MEIPRLQHHGQYMTTHTVERMDPEHVALNILIGAPVLVRFEPGDATRYTLVFFRLRDNKEHSRGMFICNIGSDSFPGIRIYSRFDAADLARDLTKNEWGQQVLQWYIQQVWMEYERLLP